MDQEIPIRQTSHEGCGAKRSIESLQAEVEVLRLDLRDNEVRHHEDIRKLWTRIVALAVAVAFMTGNHEIFNFIIGLIT